MVQCPKMIKYVLLVVNIVLLALVLFSLFIINSKVDTVVEKISAWEYVYETQSFTIEE